MKQLKIDSTKRKYETKKKANAMPMMEETRLMLSEIYRPFNMELTKLLQNDNFDWT